MTPPVSSNDSWTDHGRFFSAGAFPFPHAISTRAAGDMRDEASRRAFCRERGIEWSALVTAEQVHGNAVAVVGTAERGKRIAGVDGLITAEGSLPLAIFTADCLAVFFASRRRRAAALVHAGWRGLAKGIIPETLRAMRDRFGVVPGELSVAIGPHVQQCCYRVGRELKETFGLGAGEDYLDLTLIALRQMEQWGIAGAAASRRCTCHERELFFSYRRDKVTHRMMSVLQRESQETP